MQNYDPNFHPCSAEKCKEIALLCFYFCLFIHIDIAVRFMTWGVIGIQKVKTKELQKKFACGKGENDGKK